MGLSLLSGPINGIGQGIVCRERERKEHLENPGDYYVSWPDGFGRITVTMKCLCGDVTILPKHKVIQTKPTLVVYPAIQDRVHGCSYYVERGRMIRA